MGSARRGPGVGHWASKMGWVWGGTAGGTVGGAGLRAGAGRAGGAREGDEKLPISSIGRVGSHLPARQGATRLPAIVWLWWCGGEGGLCCTCVYRSISTHTHIYITWRLPDTRRCQ